MLCHLGKKKELERKKNGIFTIYCSNVFVEDSKIGKNVFFFFFFLVWY